jgi:hypothetical protein
MLERHLSPLGNCWRLRDARLGIEIPQANPRPVLVNVQIATRHGVRNVSESVDLRVIMFNLIMALLCLPHGGA